MRRVRVIMGCALVGAAVVAGGCGDDGGPGAGAEPTVGPRAEPVIDPGDGGHYRPVIDPADFVPTIDNPYLPFPVGARWRYEGEEDGEAQTIEVVVTPRRRRVMGVDTVVVRDTVRDADGELVEDTFDWFAQDRDGNVWYFGEETRDYEHGEVVSTEGAWEAGVAGALPGIVMPADPRVGDAYRQEYLAGEAEDMGEVIRTGETVEGPAGRYDDVVVTEDWTPLEPGTVEEKSYARDVGLVREVKVRGGDGEFVLVEAETPR
jgi:hypothetical protein